MRLVAALHCIAALAALQTLGAGDWHIRLRVFKEGMHFMWLVDINAVSGRKLKGVWKMR